MHYLIDAYNLLFTLHKYKGSFQEKRRALITELNRQAKVCSIEMTLVFDSSNPTQDLYTRSHFDAVEILYTCSKKTADELILERIEQAIKPSNYCVVSSDKDLSLKARALRAETLSLSSFLSFLFKKQNAPSKNRALKVEFTESPQEMQRLLKLFSTEKN